VQNSTLNCQLSAPELSIQFSAETAISLPPLLNYSQLEVEVTLRLTVSQSVILGVEPQTRYILLFDSYGLAFVGRPL
jgi:hypothetical protein